MRRLRFFLGGADLEMIEIGKLVSDTFGAEAVIDARLNWGARLSQYRAAMEQAAAAGWTCVAVELHDDMPPDWAPRATGRLVLVDHHGADRHRPCALRQVFDLLGLAADRWSRRFALVCANDVGHVRAMREMGATRSEMQRIRAEDRAAQGISPAEEASGRRALDDAAVILDGALTRVLLPHDRSATVTDPLALDPAFAALPRHALIIGQTSAQVFGPSAWIDALRGSCPEGWSGGDGATGFFGIKFGDSTPEAMERRIRAALQSVLPHCGR